MSKRVYAEAMYGSVLWQVIQENLATGEHSVVRKGLTQSEARKIAESLQKTPNNESDNNQSSGGMVH